MKNFKHSATEKQKPRAPSGALFYIHEKRKER